MARSCAAVVAIAPFILLSLWQPAVLAQITAAPDGTNTNVNQAGNTFNITGGTQAGSNQFHSFQQFGLNPNQVATFLTHPVIQNILARVTGSDPSIIQGQIQVTGSNANLYLVNPAGIVFGANASLNVPGSFAAATANGIGVGNGWFNAVGANHYGALTGQPSGFAFTTSQPGAIINAGNLAVGQGQSITLLGGTVINTGTIAAPGGTVTIAAVPGQNLVRITPEGSLLSLVLPTEARSAINPASATPPSLPALLTGGNLANATGITVENGVTRLTGSGTPVTLGDVVAKTIQAQTANLSAANNVTLVESQVRTTGDLNIRANNTVVVRDSIANPVTLQAGGNLTIQGDRGIDVMALNHPTAAFQSGRDLNLISNGIISGDTHYASGGNFAMQKSDGTPGTFISIRDPIISANGDVTFGNYTGPSLKVEATGNITTGNISITGTDPTFAAAPLGSDRRLLADYFTVILRAGVPVLQESAVATNPSVIPPFAVNTGGTTFTGSSATPATGRVTVGNSATPSVRSIQAEYVDISAPNGILIHSPIDAGYVKLTASAGDVTVHSIRTQFINSTGVNGDIDITADGKFRATGTLDVLGPGFLGYATGLKNYVLVDPNLIPFLVTQTGATIAQVSTAIAGSNPADGTQKMYLSTPISISSSIGTIRIRYGAGGVTTPLSAGVNLEGDNTPFVIGPNVTPNPGAPYVIRNPANNYSTFVATPFSLNKNESAALSTIPADASGTVGAIIRTVVIDGSLTVATQNRVIGSTTPLIPAAPPPESAITPPQPPTPTVTTAATTVGQDTLQRTVVSQNACTPTDTNPNPRGTPRSPTGLNPCLTTTTDDQQILKILGEDGQPPPR